MEWLLTLVATWWWLIIAIPMLAVVVITIVLFAGSKGPYPKINVHKEEETFIDSKSGQ
jgi:hypothetical protein